MSTVIANRLDITGDDIAALSDTDLRELIGRLCESDCRVSNICSTSVTYGGHQDAPDGGIDVAVKGNQSFPAHVSIPRSETVFQVKKPSMARADILKEMKPNGSLRPAIQTVMNNGGAYIIVSSSDSVTDSSLKDRIDAMKEASANDFYVDFFDRNRVATWVRTHPALILWVRAKIGRSLTGWQPYGNWAKSAGGVEEEYLVDDGLRLRDDTQNQNPNISVQDGIMRMRQRLFAPKANVRLVGLSGVGKTRLVQALFDERIGENALSPNIAFYADLSDSPNPSPEQLAEQLVSENVRAILIIDNCSPELHKKLSFICAGQNSQLSLLTVEYDVRNEDFSDETNVFNLEPSSDELITKLILNRCPHISQVDAGTIAEASGGNYRIALALAGTVKKGDNLTGLTDIQLFKRLFEQRDGENQGLMLSASALSLVYSFNGEDTESDDAELKTLSVLIDKTPAEVYRDIAELQRRDLIQSRSVWRAVLPHAIANMLAKYALESIPKDKLIKSFLSCGSDRLIRSFSRRLGYLHNVPQALGIVQELMKVDGWIGDVRNLTKFGMDVFENLAAADPKGALEAIKRAAKDDESQKFLTRENPHFIDFVKILRSIAYEKEYFKDCIHLICEIALTEDENENNNSVRSILKSLFSAYLSGTLTEEAERLEVIEDLLQSTDERKQRIALMLLDESLEAWHFSSFYGFSFGGRKRGYGYMPRGEQVAKWYGTFIAAAEKIAMANDWKSEHARRILARRFRGLWTSAHMFDALESTAKNLHKYRPWNEGWIAVRETLKYDKGERAPEIIGRLEALKIELAPNDLEQRCRAYIFSNSHTLSFIDDLDDDGNVSSRLGRTDEIVSDLGVQLGNNQEIFQKLLSGLTLPASQGAPSYFHALGRGLAQNSNKKEVWSALKEQLLITDTDKRNPDVLRGMVWEARQNDPDLAEIWLDEVLKDPVLGRWLPCFQHPIDQRGLKRLHEALDNDISDLWFYQQIAYGRAHEAISDDDLADLIQKISAKENGRYVALEILNMRFHRDRSERESLPPHSEKLLSVARGLLSIHSFEDKRHRQDSDYNLSKIAKECLKGEPGAIAVVNISKNLAVQIGDFKVYAGDYPQLLNTLAEVHPQAFMDAFLGEDTVNVRKYRLFSHDFDRERNPLDYISDDAIIEWCEKNPAHNYPIIADVVKAFDDPQGEDTQAQWRTITHLLFEKAPNLEQVLKEIGENIRPSGWSGSLASILQRRLALFPQLFDHPNSLISAWARQVHGNLLENIPKIRNSEMAESRERDESFEW
jgi:hypothetical protein